MLLSSRVNRSCSIQLRRAKPAHTRSDSTNQLTTCTAVQLAATGQIMQCPTYDYQEARNTLRSQHLSLEQLATVSTARDLRSAQSIQLSLRSTERRTVKEGGRRGRATRHTKEVVHWAVVCECARQYLECAHDDSVINQCHTRVRVPPSLVATLLKPYVVPLSFHLLEIEEELPWVETQAIIQ
ncbi:synaptonemal complex protein 1-like [Dorcoceras hygrometricum]|uniref:Synaptonemal complex protein 1-like n=1 Tax=Dorcoceras hygrometricum TaxID=472368 RepID=A0A2Z7D841_9LAMI|nr:synaptonemal complex protein 1-like [Dorcoceras hygrometricum]